jgi:hypothetical protein
MYVSRYFQRSTHYAQVKTDVLEEGSGERAQWQTRGDVVEER